MHEATTKRTRQMMTTMAMVACATLGMAATALAREPKACTATAKLLFESCKAERLDDSLVAKAICTNIGDEARRVACLADLKSEKADKKDTCAGQRELRLGACALLGEQRYDPSFDPALFDDPKNPTKPNPYFPLTVGNTWTYRGGDEVDIVEVLSDTKLIDGVPCLVFRDEVMRSSVLHEATNDWYCQRKNGDVWYLGEETGTYETYPGDVPQKPEQVGFDGSFKSGRNGDKGELFVPFSPAVGQAYLEEFSLGNAEDVTEILSTSYAFGASTVLDQLVPAALANRFCGASDCVVTKNYSLLEPGQFAHKYYAKGVGVILEVEFEDDAPTSAVSLVDCNFDARCVNLPMP